MWVEVFQDLLMISCLLHPFLARGLDLLAFALAAWGLDRTGDEQTKSLGLSS